MKWVKISEQLPEKDGWYLWWDGHYYSDRYYIVGKSYGHHYTHWLEITGPEDCCEWRRIDRLNFAYTVPPYNTSCGKAYDNKDGTCCPYCGKRIKVKE